MPDADAVAQTEDVLCAASWIADVVDADRDDSQRPTPPPTRVAVSPTSLLHRVVQAERG